MTDSRFCRNISKEITNHLNKTKECMDLKDWEQIKGIYISFPMKTYHRIKKFQNEIKEMIEFDVYFEFYDEEFEMYIKLK